MPVASEIAENITRKVIKKAVKSGTEDVAKVVTKWAESSASKDLKGTLFNNKVIKKIVRGKADWRYIILEDDTVELVDKSVINSLARSKGTAKKVEEFALKPKEGKLAQAYKSLEMHKVKGRADKKLVLDYYNNYKKQLDLVGQEVPKMSLVESEGKVFTLPTPYADMLEKEKSIKKLKDL